MQAITAFSMLSRSYFKDYEVRTPSGGSILTILERAWYVKAVDRAIAQNSCQQKEKAGFYAGCIMARWLDRAEYWLAHSTVCFITPKETH